MKWDRTLSLAVSALLLSFSLFGCAGFGHCSGAECSQDDQITARIETQLSQHPDLTYPGMVTVQTHDGVVYLNGDVLTTMQRDGLERMVSETAGVNRVVDSMYVMAESGR